MKKDLIEDSQTLANYSPASLKLRIGAADTRLKLRKRTGLPAGFQNHQASASHSNERQFERRSVTGSPNVREAQKRFNGSSNQQATDALADLKWYSGP